MPRAGALSKVLHEELTFFLDFPGIQAYSVCVGVSLPQCAFKGCKWFVAFLHYLGKNAPSEF